MGKRISRFGKLHEFTAENDIRYRGPVNYQGLQILGWLFIVISVASSFMMFGARQDPNLAKDLGSWPEVLQFMSGFSLPILLFSYNRIPKNRIISAVIPLVAVVLIFFMTLEGINMAIAGLLGGTKLDLVQIVNWLDTLKKMIGM